MTTGWGATDPEPLLLEHGPWSLELVGDRLESIHFAGVRVLRSIRCVVRDADWRTFAMMEPRAESRTDPSGALRTVVTARAERHGSIVGCALDLELGEDVLTLALRAETLTTVERNRLGLIVLHPLEDSGTTVEVTHSDGTASTTRFGPGISPHQPARDIAALAWERNGLRAELELTGDVFETEDQRNWTDASFKTYSTPLDLPFPVSLPAGAVVEQSLTLRMRRLSDAPGFPSAAGRRPDVVEIRFGSSTHPLPVIATGATTAPGPIAPRPAAIRDLAHLVELPAGTPASAAVLDRAIVEADGAALDLRLVAESPEQVDEAVRRALASPAARIARLGITHARTHVTTPQLWGALVDAVNAHAAGRQLELVGGTRAHFTELNRHQRALPSDLSGIAFSLTPQMHDEAIAQIVESLDALPQVLEDALLIAAARPLHIGPITLRPRFNAVATTNQQPSTDVDRAGYGAHLDPEATDPRWRSQAAGSWLLAVLDRLAQPGVASIALGEAAGPRGVVEGDGLTAAGEVLAWFASHAADARIPAIDSLALGDGVAVVATRNADGVEALVGSLRSDQVSVSLSLPGYASRSIAMAPWSLARVSIAS